MFRSIVVMRIARQQGLITDEAEAKTLVGTYRSRSDHDQLHFEAWLAREQRISAEQAENLAARFARCGFECQNCNARFAGRKFSSSGEQLVCPSCGSDKLVIAKKKPGEQTAMIPASPGTPNTPGSSAPEASKATSSDDAMALGVEPKVAKMWEAAADQSDADGFYGETIVAGPHAPKRDAPAAAAAAAASPDSMIDLSAPTSPSGTHTPPLAAASAAAAVPDAAPVPVADDARNFDLALGNELEAALGLLQDLGVTGSQVIEKDRPGSASGSHVGFQSAVIESPDGDGITPMEMEAGLKPGTVLDGVRIDDMIGKGGMGMVYRGRHLALDRDVAIKVLSGQTVQNRSQFTRFQAEARAIAKLEHPNVVNVYHFGAKFGHPFLVMQWLDGQSLGEKIADGRAVDLIEGLDIAIQACHGLAAAHEIGIVHRDVKPENIFVTKTGNVKVLDFGLAKDTEGEASVSQSGTFLGTPAYISPEQAKNAPLDHKTDIYSLGVSFFHIFTGELPFTGALFSILTSHALKPVPSIREKKPELPEALDDVILQMTEKNPAERPENLKVVAERLEAIFNALTSDDPNVANAVLRARSGRTQDRKRRVEKALEAAEEIFLEGDKGAAARRKRQKWIMTGAVLVLALAAAIPTVIILTTPTPRPVVGPSAGTTGGTPGSGIGRAVTADDPELIQLLDTAKAVATAAQAETVLPTLDAAVAAKPAFLPFLDDEMNRLRGLISQARRIETIAQRAADLAARAEQIFSPSQKTEAELWLREWLELSADSAEKAEELSEEKTRLDALIETAKRKEQLDMQAGQLRNRAAAASDAAMARQVKGDVEKFLADHDDYLDTLGPSLELLDSIIDAARLQAERQRQAAQFAAEANRVTASDVEAARALLGRIRQFLLDSPEFESQLAMARNRLDGILRAAIAREGQAERAARLETRGNEMLLRMDGLSPAEFDAMRGDAGELLAEIDEFLAQAPQFSDTLGAVRQRINEMIVRFSRLRALAEESRVLIRRAEEATDSAAAREVLQAIETFLARAPAFAEQLEPSRQRMVSIVADRADDTLSVPPDVNRFPWDTRLFQSTGPYRLDQIGGGYRFRHADKVFGVAVTADGQWIASAALDRTIRIFEASTGRTARLLTGHAGAVRGVVFSPNGAWLASGGQDRMVKLWDVARGRESRTFTGHRGGINAVAFAPAPNAANPEAVVIVSGSEDGTVRVWDPDTGRAVRSLNHHSAGVMAVALSADGKRMLTASTDRTAVVFDFASATEIATFRRHSAPILAAALAPDGTLAATGGEDRLVRIWRTTDAAIVATVDGLPQAVASLAFSPDGRDVLIGLVDGTVRLAAVANPADAAGSRTIRAHTQTVSAVAFRRLEGDSSSWAAVTGSWDFSVRQWTLATGEEILPPGDSHSLSVGAVAVAPDGSLAITGSLDGTAKLWNPATGRVVRSISVGETVTGVALVVATTDDTPTPIALVADVTGTITAYHAETGAKTAVVRPPGGAEVGLAVAPMSAHGSQIIVGYGDGQAVVYQVSANGLAPRHRLMPVESGDPVTAVAFDSTGNLAAVGVFDGTIRVYDLAQNAALLYAFQHPAGNVTSVAFAQSPNPLVAAGGGDSRRGGSIAQWELNSGLELQTLSHSDVVTALASTPNGRMLVSASRDATVKLWDRGRAVATLDLAETADAPLAVAYSALGRHLVVSTARGAVLIFRVNPDWEPR